MPDSVFPKDGGQEAESCQDKDSIARKPPIHFTNQALYWKGCHNSIRQEAIKYHFINAVERNSRKLHTQVNACLLQLCKPCIRHKKEGKCTDDDLHVVV